MSDVFLSLIIPVYNEERRLPATLEQVSSFLHSQPYTSEVLVVENGSQDNTLAIAREYAHSHAQFKVLQTDRQGKGIAVQQGMLATRGEYLFMCDADFSMPVSEINRFLPPALTGFEVAIASREAPGAVRYNEPSLPAHGWTNIQ